MLGYVIDGLGACVAYWLTGNKYSNREAYHGAQNVGWSDNLDPG